MRKLLAIVGVVGLVVGSAGMAAAIPTSDSDRPTTFVAGDPTQADIDAFIAGPIGGTIAGEGAAPNTCIGQKLQDCPGGAKFKGNKTVVPVDAVQHTDYVVTKLGGGLFSYQYQFENSSISPADSVTINSTFGEFTAIGVNPVGDLDITGPHNLVGESEIASICCAPATAAASSLTLGNPATWDFTGGIGVGHESIILTLLGGRPVFASWSATDSFTWTTAFINTGGELSRKVLAPSSVVPEPGSLLLLGSGITAVGMIVRRRLGKKK